MEGAAQRPLGLHNMLAEFLAGSCPRWVGSTDPQNARSISNAFFRCSLLSRNMVGRAYKPLSLHLRIREMGKRATEFVLKLDAYEMALRRQSLREEASNFQSNWRLSFGK